MITSNAVAEVYEAALTKGLHATMAEVRRSLEEVAAEVPESDRMAFRRVWLTWLQRETEQLLTDPTDPVEQADPRGVKHDGGKPRWSLLPWRVLEEVVDVLEFGARKYAPDNWQKVPDAHRRYVDAALRHVFKWVSGEKLDPESGLPHVAHAVCCLLFARWFELHT